jgi:hypothetical protein
LSARPLFVYINSSTDLPKDGAMSDNSHQSDQQPQAVRYYKSDVRGMTYTELRRMIPGWISFLIVAAIKLLGFHKKLGLGFPYPNEMIPLEPSQFPPRSAEALRPAVAEWEDQGLRLAFYGTFGAEWPVERECSVATLLSKDGSIVATTLYVRTTVGQFCQEQIFSSAVSRMPDGVLLATTTQKRDYHDPPFRRVHYLTGRTIAEVAAHHRYRLGNIPLEPERFSPAKLLDFHREEGRRRIKAMIERGVLVPMSAEEVEAERRRLRPPGSEPSTSPVAPREDTGNPYQSPATSAAPVARAQPADHRPTPLAWPLALLWLSWPPVVVFVSAYFAGEVPPLGFLLLIVLASNAGFVESLYRRRLIRRGWVRVSVWALILLGQIAAVVLTVLAATALLWLVGPFLPF